MKVYKKLWKFHFLEFMDNPVFFHFKFIFLIHN